MDVIIRPSVSVNTGTSRALRNKVPTGNYVRVEHFIINLVNHEDVDMSPFLNR
jgi:hypothetical protein